MSQLDWLAIVDLTSRAVFFSIYTKRERGFRGNLADKPLPRKIDKQAIQGTRSAENLGFNSLRNGPQTDGAFRTPDFAKKMW